MLWRWLHESLIFPSVPWMSFKFFPPSPSFCLPVDQPVLHCCSAQKHKVSLNDVISLRQPVLPVLQGQLGFGQVMTGLLVFRQRQSSVSNTQGPQSLLCSSEKERQGAMISSVTLIRGALIDKFFLFRILALKMFVLKILVHWSLTNGWFPKLVREQSVSLRPECFTMPSSNH